MNRKIRVLVVDDSAIVRKVLSDALAAEADLEIAGVAPDPIVALEMIASVRPDVLTLDLEMPKMDGLTFLRKLMKTTPLPVIVVSSIAQSGCRIAVEAMEAGAVEVLAKPAGPYSVGDLKLTLARKVRAAASAASRLTRPSGGIAARPLQNVGGSNGKVVLIGASTGGTEAIRQVLQAMPTDCPPIVAVQHIPAAFSKSFAERLNQLCRIRVREAQNGDPLEPGVALIAPGDFHLVMRTATPFQVQLRQGPRVCYQRPSVDVLFHSAAQVCGSRAIGVILTGMGNDGAAGLLALRKAGAHTIAEDETTCVVYGMPAEAARLGAARQILPLYRIGEGICAAARAQATSSQLSKQDRTTAAGHGW
jgi:two-component system chemotaxis response regulator CheB